MGKLKMRSSPAVDMTVLRNYAGSTEVPVPPRKASGDHKQYLNKKRKFIKQVHQPSNEKF